MIAPRWQVQIVNPDTGKLKVWSGYANLERAESVTATLRHHGIWAMVVRVDDEPEPDLPRAA